MKIIIVTQDDPFYIPIFFDTFLRKYSIELNRVKIEGIVIQRPLGQRSRQVLLRRMIEFYGPNAFFVVLMKYVYLKTENKLYKLGLLREAFSIEYFCRKYNVPILRYTNVNHPKFIEFIKRYNIDLIISVAASQIFKNNILRTPRLGCINIHNAPLPRYRGMMPSFWQMFYGEKYIVATVHEMVEEIDKGRIITQIRTPIDTSYTLDRLIKKTRELDAGLVVKVIRMFQGNKVKYYPLQASKGSYFSFPTKRDVVEFKKRGYRII